MLKSETTITLTMTTANFEENDSGNGNGIDIGHGKMTMPVTMITYSKWIASSINYMLQVKSVLRLNPFLPTILNRINGKLRPPLLPKINDWKMARYGLLEASSLL